MIIPSRKTWRGNAVPPVIVDDEHAHLLRGVSVFRRGGYPAVSVGSKPVTLHRFLWERVHGALPPLLDHINGDKWDNRICNLRPATKSLNGLNRHAKKSRPLPAGVYLDTRGRKPYYSLITIGGRRRYLGYFDTPGEAADAYERARAEAIEKEAAGAATAETA